MKFCKNCGLKLNKDIASSPEASQNASSEVVGTQDLTGSVENEVSEGYIGENGGVAVPKVSDYRERYKKHQLRARDIKTESPIVPLKRMDGELDKFGDLVFGEGLTQEI